MIFEDEDMDKGKIRVINNSMFDSLLNYSIVYEIYQEGDKTPIAKGNLKTPIASQSSKVYQIPIRVYVPRTSKNNYFVKFLLKSKKEIYGVDQNTIFATGEIRVPVKKARQNYISRAEKLELARTRTALTLFNDNVYINFDTITGDIIGYEVDGVDLVNSGKINIICKNERLSVNNITESISSKFTTLTIDYILKDSSKIEVLYKIYNSGVISVSTQNSKEKTLIEMALNLPSSWKYVVCERRKIQTIDSDFKIKDISYLGISKNVQGANSLLFIADDNLMNCHIDIDNKTSIIIKGNKFTIVPISTYNDINRYLNLNY